MSNTIYDVLEKLDFNVAIEIWTLVQDGKSVEAIKLLAEVSDLSLKDARPLILSLQKDEHREGSGVSDLNDPNNIGYWR